jgi:transposase-like protein
MSKKSRVQRTPEEKWQIVLEVLKSRNVAETCRKYEIASNLYYRWKDEVRSGSQGCAWGEKRSGAARCRAGEADQATGAGAGPVASADRDLTKTCWASELRASAFVGTGIGGPGERSEAGGGDPRDQPVQPLLSATTARPPCGSLA